MKDGKNLEQMPALHDHATGCQLQDKLVINHLCDFTLACKNYWASEVSPTLGCSIEISHDIYNVHVSVVCQINCVGGIT